MAHARLAPSSAARWMDCPGSAAFDQEGPQSAAAAEGTVLHELAAAALEGRGRPEDAIGRVFTHNGTEVQVSEEAVAAVTAYVNDARDAIGDDPHAVEVSVPIEQITHEPGARGTADLLIFRDGELEVRDAKFGRGVSVDAQDNPQLLLYALGALDEYAEVLGQIERVRCVVHQPRLAGPKEVVYTLDDMRAWRKRFLHAAADAWDAINTQGSMPAAAWEEKHLRPTTRACQFCAAKRTCPALRAEAFSVAGHFEDLTARRPDELAADFGRVARVRAWCDAVEKEAERRLAQGEPVPGLKLVQGRRGPRRWADEKAAEALLSQALPQTWYERVLISPVKAVKLLGEREDVAALIVQSEGRPVVALEDDPRPAVAASNLEMT